MLLPVLWGQESQVKMEKSSSDPLYIVCSFFFFLTIILLLSNLYKVKETFQGPWRMSDWSTLYTMASHLREGAGCQRPLDPIPLEAEI